MDEDKFYSGESEQSVYKEGNVKYQGEYQQNTTDPQENTYQFQQGAYQQGTYQQDVYQQGTYQQGAYPQGAYQQNAYQQNDYQQNEYWQNTNGQNMYQQPERKPSQAFGIASLVLGIISLLFFYSCCNVLLAVLAIIFGVIQLAQNKSGKGMAIAGIITSVLSVVLLIVFYVLFMFSVDFQSMLDDQLSGYGTNPNIYEYYDELFPDDYNLEKDFGGDDTF